MPILACRLVLALAMSTVAASGAINYAGSRVASFGTLNVPSFNPLLLQNGVMLYLQVGSPSGQVVMDVAGARTYIPSVIDPDTGFPVSYGTISEYALDGMSVALLTSAGIYLWESGHVTRVVGIRDQIPGRPANELFTTLRSISISRIAGPGGTTVPAVVFIGVDDVSKRQYLYRYRSGVLEKLVDTTMTSPNGRAFGTLPFAVADGSSVVFSSEQPNYTYISLFRYSDGAITELLAGTPYPSYLGGWKAQDGAVAFSFWKGIRVIRNGVIEPVAGPVTYIDGVPYVSNYRFQPWGVTSRDVLFSAEWWDPYTYLYATVPPNGFVPPFVVKSRSTAKKFSDRPKTRPTRVVWGVRRGGVNHKLLIDGKEPNDPISSVWERSVAIGVGSRDGFFTYYRADEVGWQPRPVPADYDGDGFEDIVLFEPASGHWVMRLTGDDTTVRQFGYEGATQSPADYDGDGLTDLAVYDPATGGYYANRSTAGHLAANLGLGNGVPVPADYDGDGAAEMAVYQASSGFWHIRASDGAISTRQLGFAGTQAVPGDYDGDGKDDSAVYEPGTGNWYIMASGAGFEVRNFGFANAVPVPGNYDGDAATELAVYEPATGTWYVQFSPSDVRLTQFGSSASTPLPGDHDGDGIEDIAVYFPYDRSWYVLGSAVGFIQK